MRKTKRIRWRKNRFWPAILLLTALSLPVRTVFCQEAENEMKKENPGVPEKVEVSGTGGVLLNFRDAEIQSLLQYYSEVTGLAVIPGDGVQGTVTIICPVEIPLDAAVSVIESVLELKGFTIVKQSDRVVKVVPKRDALERNIETKSAAQLAAIQPEDVMVTQLVQMKYVDAAEMMADLQPLVSKSGNMFFNERTNILVITDTGSNIKRLAGIIRELDIEVAFGKPQIKIIPLVNADEVALSTTLNEIFTSEVLAGDKKIKLKFPPPPGMAEGEKGEAELKGLETLSGKVKIIPDSRMHALIVIALNNDMPTIQALISSLDREPKEDVDTTLVYYLENAEASEIAAILNSIYGAGAGKKEGGSALSNLAGRVSIDPDTRTNSLVITTSPSNFDTIQRLIKKLDIEPPQVLIEALIAEVTLDEKQYQGVDWNSLTFSMKDNKFVGSPETLWSVFQGGFKYTLTETDTQAQAIVQLLKQAGKVDILSEPRISTSNNKEAMIMVGDKIPVLKQYQQSTEGSASLIQNYEYTDVGIKLIVTPRINQERVVTLKIKQEINEYVGDVPVGTGTAPQFSTRQAETNRVVMDGQTVVIGGLIKDKRTESLEKIPILGSIPIIGFFFRKTSEIREKKELLVFITPRVMLKSDEALDMTKQQERDVKGAGNLKKLKDMHKAFSDKKNL